VFDNTLVTALLVDVDPTTVIKVAYVSFTALDVKKGRHVREEYGKFLSPN